MFTSNSLVEVAGVEPVVLERGFMASSVMFSNELALVSTDSASIKNGSMRHRKAPSLRGVERRPLPYPAANRSESPFLSFDQNQRKLANSERLDVAS